MKAAIAEKPVQVEQKVPVSPGRTQSPLPVASVPIWNQSPWKWFFSLGLGVFLLVLVAIASVVGTLITPLERAQEVVYYTWWFKAMLLALAVIMSCATVKTIMLKLMPTRALRVHHQKSFFDLAHLSASIPFAGTAEEAARIFHRHGFKVKCEENAGAARSGWWGRFGAPVSHLGMVIVLLAGFVSSWVAQEALVQIPEGRTTSTMQLRSNLDEVLPLGFTITLDDFSTGFFPRTRIPSHYTSYIQAHSGNRLLYAGAVEVNHSPKIKGWRLHQTSYQELPTLPRYEVEVAGPGLATPMVARVSPGQTLTLPGSNNLEFSVNTAMGWVLSRGSDRLATGSLMAGGSGFEGLALVANRFEPDFVLGEDRSITSRSQELNNPALHVTLLREGSPVLSQWLFGREDMRSFSHSPSGMFSMELLDVQMVENRLGFVVALVDRSSGMLIARSLLMLGQETIVETAASKAHADCADCGADHGATTQIANSASGEEGWSVTLGERVTGYATVLTLSRNPTIPVIYFGCVLMMVGLMMSFFVPRRDVWFLHDKSQGVLRVVAHYRHLSEEFDRATRATIAHLENAGHTASSHDKES